MGVRRCVQGVVLAALLAAPVAMAAAQDFAFGWDPRTGDATLDARLADINHYGDRYREAFVDELVRYHGAPRTLVGVLLADDRWAPGDVYYACALARAVGRPCRHLLELWRAEHADGWEAVAGGVGVTPASADFRRVVEGIEDSYRRWGRPMPAVEAVDGSGESAARPEGP